MNSLRKPNLLDVETSTLAGSRGSVNFGNKRIKVNEFRMVLFDASTYVKSPLDFNCDVCLDFEWSTIAGWGRKRKNSLLYGLGRGPSSVNCHLKSIQHLSNLIQMSSSQICSEFSVLHPDSTRCLTSCEGKSCRHWEIGWRAQFSSKLINVQRRLFFGKI